MSNAITSDIPRTSSFCVASTVGTGADEWLGEGTLVVVRHRLHLAHLNGFAPVEDENHLVVVHRCSNTPRTLSLALATDDHKGPILSISLPLSLL